MHIQTRGKSKIPQTHTDVCSYLLNNRNKPKIVYTAKTNLSLCPDSLLSSSSPQATISFSPPHFLSLTAPPTTTTLSLSLCIPTPNIYTPTWFSSGQAGSGHGNTPRSWVSQQSHRGPALNLCLSGGGEGGWRVLLLQRSMNGWLSGGEGRIKTTGEERRKMGGWAQQIDKMM